jgi:hypothetical protein
MRNCDWSGLVPVLIDYLRREPVIAYEHFREGLADLFKAVLLSSFFLMLHGYLEERSFGHELRLFEHALLQDSLATSRSEDRLPVVIDISALRKDGTPVNRPQLDRLLRELKAYKARAIGIDIDFSPTDEGSLVVPEDWNYLESWGKLEVPLHFGVYRRALDSSGRWLGKADFTEMAAGLTAPFADPAHNYYFIQTPSHQYLIQLAAALFEDMRGTKSLSEAGVPVPVRVLTTDFGISVGDYLIDYSSLPQLRKQVIDYHSADSFSSSDGGRIQGNAVLVGDIRDTDDLRCVPSYESPVPGVLLNACSYLTLRRRMLTEVSGTRARVLDLIILLAVSGVALGIRWALISWPARWPFDYHNLEIALFSLSALVFLVGFWAYVAVHRIFWPDFLWVVFALWLHPFFSEPFWRIVRAFGRALRTFVKDFFGASGPV